LHTSHVVLVSILRTLVTPDTKTSKKCKRIYDHPIDSVDYFRAEAQRR